MSDKPKMNTMQRTIQYLFLLSRHGYNGVRAIEVQKSLELTASMVHRDFHALRDEGMLENVPGREDHWRLAPRIIQVAVAHQRDSSLQHQRLDEYTQRCAVEIY